MRSDEELLEAWRNGDKRAGGELFHRHFESVRRFVVNKVDGGVEDIVQKTFMACVEGRERFAGRSSFRVYLLGIAFNMVRKHWAASAKAKRTDDIDERAIADMGAGPSTLVGRDQNERMLLAGLRQISLADQTVLELYYWERMNGRALGEFLGVPENTARARLRRAKLSLAERMRKMEQHLGIPPSTEDDLDSWAGRIRAQLVAVASS